MGKRAGAGAGASEYTPGPWRVEAPPRGTDSWYVHDAAGADVARVHGGYAHSEGNARLIAAAPELCELLSWAVEWTKQHHGSVTPEAEWEQARALLARIEGEGE